MEITSLTKYITLNKLVNGTTEVLFSGQPCLTVAESQATSVGSDGDTRWRINPAFAKLFYGANVFEDIPYCLNGFVTVEEAIADGLIKLHELGAFNTIHDFPEDTYTATMHEIAEDVKQFVLKHSINESVSVAHSNYLKVLNQFKGGDADIQSIVSEYRERSEASANNHLAGKKSPIAPIEKPTAKSGKYVVKGETGSVISRHDNDVDALTAFKSLSATKGVKIIKESEPEAVTGDVFSRWVAKKNSVITEEDVTPTDVEVVVEEDTTTKQQAPVVSIPSFVSNFKLNK